MIRFPYEEIGVPYPLKYPTPGKNGAKLMKKRIITLLLVLCTVFSLAPTALAADEQNQDYIAFYLTQYELQAGDTMSAVCKNRDINFANYKTIIQNINNISNFNYLIAGRKYWLPAKSVGSATEYYAVYRHTLVAGDTVGALCTKYGISLSENEKLIKQLNGNPKNLSSFYVGTPIYIPVPSGKVGSAGGTVTTPPATATPAPGTTVTPAPGGTTTTPPATTTPAPSTGAQNKDYVAFYLTRHKLEKGDNLTNVCSRRGINFSKYKTLIQDVNKISNFNYLIAGREYWVPATTPGAATEYYTVYAHMLLPGDTVYNLCVSYGISMSKNEDMIKKLNGNPKSLTSFKANTLFYIPVHTEKAAGSTTVVPGTGTLPDDAANAGTGAGTSTPTAPPPRLPPRPRPPPARSPISSMPPPPPSIT